MILICEEMIDCLYTDVSWYALKILRRLCNSDGLNKNVSDFWMMLFKFWIPKSIKNIYLHLLCKRVRTKVSIQSLIDKSNFFILVFHQIFFFILECLWGVYTLHRLHKIAQIKLNSSVSLQCISTTTFWFIDFFFWFIYFQLFFFCWFFLSWWRTSCMVPFWMITCLAFIQ